MAEAESATMHNSVAIIADVLRCLPSSVCMRRVSNLPSTETFCSGCSLLAKSRIAALLLVATILCTFLGEIVKKWSFCHSNERNGMIENTYLKLPGKSEFIKKTI